MRRIIFILLLFLCSQVNAVDYYSDPVSGSNANNGLTTSTAFEGLDSLFQTQGDDKIERFNAGGVSQGGGPITSGDTIYLMTGDHGRVLRASTRAAYYNTSVITIDKAPGESPVVQSIHFRQNKNWKVQNITIDYSQTDLGWATTADACFIYENCTDSEITGCTLFSVDELSTWTDVTQDSIWTLVPDAPATAGSYIITLTMTDVDDATTDYQCFNVSDEDLYVGTTAQQANKLIDTGQNFDVTISVGMTVKNISAGTYTTVTNVDSASTLSLTDDIFQAASGETYKIGWIEWDADADDITDALEVGLPAGWDSGHATATGSMDTDPVSSGVVCTFIHAGDSTRPGGRNDISGAAVSTGNLTDVASVTETETQQGINDWHKAVGGINLMGNDCNNITVTNNSVRNTFLGIWGHSDDNLIIRSNTINTFTGDAMQISVGPNMTINNNTIYNRIGAIINVHGDMLQTLGTIGTADGSVVQNNTLIAMQDDALPNVRNCQGFLLGGVSDWLIQNNLIVTNNVHGINATGAAGANITNNTVVRNFLDSTDVSPIVRATSGSGSFIRNNIANSFDYDSVTQSNNIDVGVDATYYQLFTDYDNGDFTLKAGSPAIDAGTSTDAPSDDILGNSRPQGSGFDIGAYEYTGGNFWRRFTRTLRRIFR